MEHTYTKKLSAVILFSIFICKIWQYYLQTQSPGLAPRTRSKTSPGQCSAFDLVDLLKSCALGIKEISELLWFIV